MDVFFPVDMETMPGIDDCYRLNVVVSKQQTCTHVAQCAGRTVSPASTMQSLLASSFVEDVREMAFAAILSILHCSHEDASAALP